MEKEAFISLLKNPPEEYSIEQLNQLETLLGQYPYFQNAWALHLKGLKPFDDTAYTKALKRCAALTTDREVLFEFISNEEFTQTQLAEGHPAHQKEWDEDSEAVLSIPDTDLEFAPADPESKSESESQSDSESGSESEEIPEEDNQSQTDAIQQEATETGPAAESDYEYVDADEFPDDLWKDENAEPLVAEEQVVAEETEVAEEQSVEEEQAQEEELEALENQGEVEPAHEALTEAVPEELIETAPEELIETVPEEKEAEITPEILEDSGDDSETSAEENHVVTDEIPSPDTIPSMEEDYLDELTEEPLSENDHLVEQPDHNPEEEEPSFALIGDSEPLKNLDPITEEETEMDLITDTALSMGHNEEANLSTHPMFQTDFEWDREPEVEVPEEVVNGTGAREKKSFSDWLGMTQARKREPVEEAQGINDAERERKFELLDKFLEKNPRIIPVVSEEITVDIEESVSVDREEIMTETLAQLYREQGKFKKALKGYEVLRLKYPEKSGFFAAQIQELKVLIKEKKKN